MSKRKTHYAKNKPALNRELDRQALLLSAMCYTWLTRNINPDGTPSVEFKKSLGLQSE